uniref:protein-glutamine gamma-glutamyltransferase n=1 Tax=Amphilophus citrinellus TaxID=61819 RepID=A0A3Q0T0R5_AMPCI
LLWSALCLFLPLSVALDVQNINMCQDINKPKHYTTDYNTPNLVVRRGQEFVMRVTFNRPLVAGDDFHIEFQIGSDPSPNKGSLVMVNFGNRINGLWSGQILESQGQCVTFGITPTTNAIVGKFQVYVAISRGNGMQRTKRDAATDMYLLFNAWCPEDHVFLPDEAERQEYVLNDEGVIYQGSSDSVTERPWTYGQFERGILDACIFVLDASQMPIYDRGNIVKVVRVGSAMMNSQDDNGVMVGNWSNDYSMGKPPTSWTGSTKILLQYANTGVPVCFAQCWVFAGVFNTFLRCLGIPARVITNYNSAHDNTGNLKTDLIFNADGTPDRRNTRDSIWNYHCWNEVIIKRSDLPPGLEGWQVVDATPQETSDGYFRCGPAPVIAIKEGQLCYPFDCGFVFAEVNSDVVFLKRDKYGNLTPFKVDKTYIGEKICTKAVGSQQAMNITDTYKFPEGNTHTHIHTHTHTHTHTRGPKQTHNACDSLRPPLQCDIGQDIQLTVTFKNNGNILRTVQAHLDCDIIFYTGVVASHFKDIPFNATVLVPFKIPAYEYQDQLSSQTCVRFMVTAQSGNVHLLDFKVVELQTPSVKVMVGPQLNQEMAVKVEFTNIFSFPLRGVTLSLEGAGLIAPKTKYYREIAPQTTISWQEVFTPRLPGLRRITALIDCQEVRQVTSTTRPAAEPTHSCH